MLDQITKRLASGLAKIFRRGRRKPIVIRADEEVHYMADGTAVKMNTKTGERQPFYLSEDDELVVLEGGAIYAEGLGIQVTLGSCVVEEGARVGEFNDRPESGRKGDGPPSDIAGR